MQCLVRALFVSILLVATAGALDILGKAKAAEALAADGKFVAVMDTLDEAEAALWDKSPLIFRRPLSEAEPPVGYSAYMPGETDAFRSASRSLQH